jgi:hypothetical protein
MALTYVLNVQDNGSVTIKKMEVNVNSLKQSFTNIDKQVNIFGKSLGFLKTAGAAALGSVIAQGVNELKKLGKEMIDSYDSAAKLSQNIGVTAESVLGLRHAAELSGVGAEAMDKNMEKLSKTMFDAATGNKAASESFARLGVAVTNSDGSLKKSDAVLMEMADKFKALPPGAAKAAAAMDIFGKSGASMVSMLKNGSAGLKEMVDEGAGASGKAEAIAEAMEKLNDAGTKAKAALMGIFAGFVESDLFKANVAALKEISESIIKWRKESKEKSENKQKENLENLAKAAGEYEEQLEKVMLLQKKIITSDGSLEKFEKFNEISLEGLKQAANTSTETRKIYNELNKAQTKLNTLKGNQGDLEKELYKSGTDNLAIAQKILEGRNKANTFTDHSYARFKIQEKFVEGLKSERKVAEEAAAKEAQAAIDFAKNQKAKEEAARKAAQAWEAEGKRLDDFLKNYQDSKRTESQIAEDNFNEEKNNFDALLKRKKISQDEHSAYLIAAEGDYIAKVQEMRGKAEEAAQSKTLELRRIIAKDYGDIAELEIQQIKIKYDKERKLAEDSKADITLIKRAEQAEIKAVREKERESQRQHNDMLRSYRETAAANDADRIAIQMESINARYDAEREKAQGNAEMIVEIERAKNAELERMERQLAQVRQELAMQYIDSTFQVANAVAVFGKDSGNAQKAIAMSQAMINTALAATKAATAAPFPANIPLVAGAVAQGAVQMKTISAQKFYTGGMIPGSNTLIMANEQGREAILNPRAVREVGGEAGVNALNRGTSNTYNNSRSSVTNINISTSILSQKTFRDEIEPILKRAERRL